MLTREQIAARAARELKSGESVRLGAAVSELLRAALPPGTELREEGADVAIIAAREVSAAGELSGAEEIGGAKRVIAILEQHREGGEMNVRGTCRAPVNGKAERIITNLAIFDVTDEGLVMREVAPGVSAFDVQQECGTPLLAADDLRVVDFP